MCFVTAIVQAASGIPAIDVQAASCPAAPFPARMWSSQHVSGAAAAACKMRHTETVLHFYCHSCKVFRHKHASSDFKQPSDSLPSTNPISSTASRPNTKLSARLTASSSKGTCCSDIALNPCLCHPSYVFCHCYSSGSFRHPSNRCASSKLSCSAFSRPNVEFSACLRCSCGRMQDAPHRNSTPLLLPLLQGVSSQACFFRLQTTQR